MFRFLVKRKVLLGTQNSQKVKRKVPLGTKNSKTGCQKYILLSTGNPWAYFGELLF